MPNWRAGLARRPSGSSSGPSSPRYIAPEAARIIAAEVPPHVMKVGVFVDEDIENVSATSWTSLVWTSRSFTEMKRPTIAGELGRKDLQERSAIEGYAGWSDISEFDPDVVLLVDAHDPERYGGTGRTVNWDSAREIAVTRPTILAGGLNAANIRLALRSVRPYGVDVSSGVESAPGVKDPVRLRSFFEALHD